MAELCKNTTEIAVLALKRQTYVRPSVRAATPEEVRRVLAIQLREAARELELPGDYSGSALVRVRSVLEQLGGETVAG